MTGIQLYGNPQSQKAGGLTENNAVRTDIYAAAVVSPWEMRAKPQQSVGEKCGQGTE